MKESTLNHQALCEKLTQITKAMRQVGLQWYRADVTPLRDGERGDQMENGQHTYLPTFSLIKWNLLQVI